MPGVSADLSEVLARKELEPAECFDEGLRLARRLIRGRGLAAALLLAPLAWGLAAGIPGWLQAAEDLKIRVAPVGPGSWSATGTVTLLNGGHVLMQFLELWVLVLVVRGLQDGAGRATGRTGAQQALLLAVAGTVLVHLPVLLVCPLTDLLAGRTLPLPFTAFAASAEHGLQHLQGWLMVPVLLLQAFIKVTVLLAACAAGVEGRAAPSALARGFRLRGAARGRTFLLVAGILQVQVLLTLGVHVLWLEMVPLLSSPSASMLGTLAGPGSASYLMTKGFLAPLTGMAFLMSYVDVRVRAEGWDVVWQARQAGLLEEEGVA